jgi:hypothetical protein
MEIKKIVPSWKWNDYAKPIFFNQSHYPAINHISTGSIGTGKSLFVRKSVIPQAYGRGYQVCILDVENEYPEIPEFFPILDLSLISREMVVTLLNKSDEPIYLDAVVRCLVLPEKKHKAIFIDEELSDSQIMYARQAIKRINKILTFEKGETIFKYLNRAQVGRIVLNPNYSVMQLIMIVKTIKEQYKDRDPRFLGTILILEELEALQDLDEDRFIPNSTNYGRKRGIFLYFITHEPLAMMECNQYWGSSIYNFQSCFEYSKDKIKESRPDEQREY